MYPQDEELHQELMRVFRQYFNENQTWQADASKASSIRVRNCLNEIKHLCLKRRKEILLWQRDKDQQLLERKLKRKAQKKGTGN
jgi:hypothetical protein